MFKEILEKTLRKNKDLDGLVDEIAKKEIHEMVGSILDQLDAQAADVPDETREQIATKFEEELGKSFDEIGFSMKDEADSIENDMKILLAKLRKKSKYSGDPEKWESFFDIDLELQAIERANMDLSEMDTEIQKLIAKNEESFGPITERIQRNLKEKIEAGGIGPNGELDPEPDPRLYFDVQALLKKGGDANERSYLFEYPIEHARELSRWDIVWLLLEHGANMRLTGWENAHLQLLFGSDDGFEKALDGYDLPRVDKENKTIFDLCIQKDDLAKFDILVNTALANHNPDDLPLAGMLAVIETNQLINYLQVLVAAGLTLPMMEHGNILHLALQANDDAMLSEMLGQGADVNAIEDLFPSGDDEADYASAQALIKMGWDPAALIRGNVPEQMRFVTGACLGIERELTRDDITTGRHRIFGSENPQKISHPFWKEAIRSGLSAYAFREDLKIDVDDDGPIWCFDRFGMSTTQLSDGRWVQIGGEHEDHYDPDFLIYNDVVVHDGDGGVNIYTYPKSVFPPTDFHTATDVGDDLILIIGNLGYQEERRVGHTQVVALDLRDFSMRPLNTHGDVPGWISGHSAELQDGQVIIEGGNVQTEDGLEPLKGRFALDLTKATWRRLDT